ncbi:GMC oxidoreductase [Podospora aff. communis PSN243]|uniref:GMC oxidoreductase n=1 Tax=Podospora aff. communis PSN243 TaxID=3040156 RepID=A0AAV9GSV2_9PEZI|nr:GMC oxidoreductase [Podospora aff. communis PSN243]
MKLSPSTFILLLSGLADAVPHTGSPHGRRQVGQPRDGGYDFIIAGGGTSGLTVADRLSEKFPEKTVLVVEYGDVEYAPGTFDPPTTVWGRGTTAKRWDVNSQPMPEFKNKTAVVFAGQVVGGSSAVNGMFFDRPARQDLNAWDDAAGDWESKDKWDWDTMYPYFKKSVTFTPPSAADAQKYGFTWDASVYGSTTPIYSSFPPFLWADHQIVRDAWKEVGAAELKECAGGDKSGLCWIPLSQHPVTARRSHAGTGHYLAVNASRSNYDLLVKHQVVRLVWPNGNTTSGPPTVEVRSLSTNTLFNITAKAEVILSAGVFNTPAILQRSGIGKPSILSKSNIPTLINLPGVGSNLQDHSGAMVAWNLTKPPSNLSPLPDLLSDPTFLADALAGFNSTPARGPYTLANSNSAIYIPHPTLAGPNHTHTLTSRIHRSIHDRSALLSLPPDYSNDPALSAGYTHQLTLLASLLSDPHAPSLESTWATGNSTRAINLHPLSRGTVRLNLTHPLELPVVDYRTASNPLDFTLYIDHIRYLRKMISTKAMQAYGAVEVSPGAAVQSDEALREYVKEQMIFSFMHPCCTAAMLPREKGGVVGRDLGVYGARGVRVVDVSVLPFLPSSHLSALAYALGERAADLVGGDWEV